MDRTFVYVRFLLVLVLGLSVSLPVRAEPVVTTRYEYYDIQGVSKDDVRHAMQRHGSRFTGGDHDASTEWNIHWNCQPGEADGGYRVISYQVSMDIVYHMPRWSNEPNELFPLRHEWDAFAKALQNHEDGHARIARDCARQVEEDIKQVKTCRSASELQGVLNRTANMTISKCQLKEVEYDAKTNHGMAQGAVW